jgi:RNA polymerase sigma-70 factor (ECF subfamily)
MEFGQSIESIFCFCADLSLEYQLGVAGQLFHISDHAIKILKHLPTGDVCVFNMSTNVKPIAEETLKTRPSLLSKVRRGDEEGWRRFYDLYENFIRAAARGAGLSREEAQDVVQETMITVRDYIAMFVPDANRGKFRTWLRKIVSTRIADQYRKKVRNPLARTGHSEEPVVIEDGATSTTNRIPNLTEVELDRLIDRELEMAILNKARKLAKEIVNPENFQAYDLFDIREMSAHTVAESLGISSVTVRVRAFRARQEVNRQVRRIVKQLDKGMRLDTV